MSQDFRHSRDQFMLSDQLRAKAASFRIVDAHCHIYPPKIAVKATAAVGAFYGIDMHVESGDPETLLAGGAEIGCRRYVVCSVATKAEQVDSIDRFISSECAKHPAFIGLGAWHEDIDDVDALLDRTQELGLVGIKVHPDFQGIDIDDPRLMPLYAGLQERGMPLLVHMGDERYEHSRPRKLAKVLERFDGLKVDAAHFGGWQAWDEAYACLKGSQAMFDTSSCLMILEPERAREMIEGYGIDKMMFGVDFPMWSHAAEFARVWELGLDDEALRALFYDNAQRLYGFKDLS